MGSYNLNEVLKERENRKRSHGAAPSNQEEAMKLDDVARVKVLSPGRKVFKRFIRNRLAVFGSVTLIILFVFSFFGPIVYPYGQKQIFYKYDVQNVNYALAKQNTSFNGYALGEETVERDVANAMNSNIKQMLADGEDVKMVLGTENGYAITKLTDDIVLVEAGEMRLACTAGSGEVQIGTYDAIKKTINFSGAPVEGLAEAVGVIKGTSAEVTLDGMTYRFQRDAAKSYNVFAELNGIHYYGEAQDAGFEAALNQAMTNGDGNFFYGGTTYQLIAQNSTSVEVYAMAGKTREIALYTSLTLDTHEVGASVSDELKANALYAATCTENGEFSADGEDYAIHNQDGVWVIYDDSGEEYAEFSHYSIRRYTGADTMEYDLKQALAETIESMNAAGQKTGTLTYNLPQQSENGEYVYDENGELMYSETEMKITQRDTGEYVVNCDQVNYIIDMFAAPSSKHILGTDGDGFDVMSRIMYGGRISLMVGFVVIAIETFLGVIMGGLAGYYGGWVDNLIMRLVDIFYCLPSMPIMIILGAMMDAMRMDTYLRLIIMMAALGIMGWAGVARLVRGQILSLREQEFMIATEATGIKVRDRIFHHLVPNVMPQLIVTATMGIGGVILTESTLSFLGLGVKHPLATWGTIINSVSSASAMAHYVFIWLPVGLLICLTVIAFNFVGDGLRDAYDPKSKR